MKRLGWIVIGWTGRSWVPFHDTTARTRTEALAKWRQPLGIIQGWRQWEKGSQEGLVKCVRTHFTEAH